MSRAEPPLDPLDDEVVADYDVRSPLSRTILTVVGTIVAVAALYGLAVLASLLMKDTRTAEADVEVPSSNRVVLQVGSSDVKVSESDGDAVGVTATLTDGLTKTDFAVAQAREDVTIDASCHGWLNPGCGASVEVAVPRGVTVDLRVDAGDVDVAGLRSGLTVSTGEGDVTASALRGSVQLATGDGSVEATDLRVDEIDARTDTGSVDVAFVREPYAVKVQTGGGDVTARLPAGERTYQVITKTDSGAVDSDVESDTGGGLIRVVTTSGDIRITRA